MSTGQFEVRFRQSILDQVDAILKSCEESQRPLELDPARGELFELFVTVEAQGGLKEESGLNLDADGLCQSLADRWGLKDATQQSVREQSKLSPEHLARMRSLWSLLRMWMEWTYAWQRWPEFHKSESSSSSATSPQT